MVSGTGAVSNMTTRQFLLKTMRVCKDTITTAAEGATASTLASSSSDIKVKETVEEEKDADEGRAEI